MIRLVVGIAIGYVLGARAGHAHYEQIVRLSSKVTDNPAIQGVARLRAGETVRRPSEQGEARAEEA